MSVCVGVGRSGELLLGKHAHWQGFTEIRVLKQDEGNRPKH